MSLHGDLVLFSLQVSLRNQVDVFRPPVENDRTVICHVVKRIERVDRKEKKEMSRKSRKIRKDKGLEKNKEKPTMNNVRNKKMTTYFGVYRSTRHDSQSIVPLHVFAHMNTLQH
tara:strand:+ start:390 stop:731 length:342 start_codon:yes stop_codon:yes gene_type:complete